jgi:hypothetical protein
MSITYTQTRLEIKCYPDDLIVGKREARDAILWTQGYFDDLPEVESESIPAVLYGEDDDIPDGKQVGDIKIEAVEIRNGHRLGDEMFPAITADEATAGFTVPAGQFMTHLDVEYTGTDDTTGNSATCETLIPLGYWDDIVEADFVAFADVTEAWVQAKVSEWYNNFEVEVDISRKIKGLNSDPVTVAKPWA